MTYILFGVSIEVQFYIFVSHSMREVCVSLRYARLPSGRKEDHFLVILAKKNKTQVVENESN